MTDPLDAVRMHYDTTDTSEELERAVVFHSTEEMDAYLDTIPSECPVAEEPLRTNRCPEPDEYGRCVCCGFRVGVACVCGMTFAERAHTVGIDQEALRKFHGS